MKIDYSHNLSVEETYTRIDNLLSDLQKKYADKISNPKITWNSEHTKMDYHLSIVGFGTEGHVILKKGKISLEGKIPFLATPFTGKIEEAVKKQLVKLLS